MPWQRKKTKTASSRRKEESLNGCLRAGVIAVGWAVAVAVLVFLLIGGGCVPVLQNFEDPAQHLEPPR